MSSGKKQNEKKNKQGRTGGAVLYNVTRKDLSQQINLEERLKRSEGLGM